MTGHRLIPRQAVLAVVAVILLAAVALTATRVTARARRVNARATPAATPESSRLSGFASYAAEVTGAHIDARRQADPGSPLVVRLNHISENGAPQTFLVENEQRGRDEQIWYHVLLPIRPNGSTGWVRASDVRVVGIRYELDIHLRTFRLDLLEDRRRISVIPIGVGTQNTPTPAGRYYVKELLQPPNPNTVYGHYVLGLSGFSNVLVNWPGGGVIGIHGTNDLRSIGRKVSHGCIRMSNENIERLARLLPLGTPVRVFDD